MLTVELNQGEKIIKIVRRHWIAIVGPVTSFLIMVIIPPVLFAVLNTVFPVDISDSIFGFAIFLYSIWCFFGLTFLLYSWTNYYLDVWIVTNLRIFAVDQQGFFRRQISSMTFDKINDLTISINGVLATFLKFGLVSLETAAERRVLIFKTARDPEEVKRTINDAQDEYQGLY